MDPLLPLPVAVPLLVAAALTAFTPVLSHARRLLDALAILTAVGVFGLTVAIMVKANGSEQVYWFANFRPARGVALGIDFAAGPLNAGLAALAALLATMAMIFSWRYFAEFKTYYQVLMLVFLAGMVGFCLTGDIFDLFVWFEVMGVAAYALTAYRPEERGPLQGALNFAITNSVGAYLSLSGIGLVYGRTGALNMAQIGRALAARPPDGLVVVAFLLITSGLLIKASVAPFHFWLADAHAVAPTPVCILFSGVMVELGLYGIARVYWTMFAAGLGHRAAITDALTALGVLTALVGAFFCLRQRHLKRLLAFSTISHAGMFLIGIALLTPLGLAGAALYVVGHGLVKAALFLCVGIILHRLRSVNETALHGRGRHLRLTGVLFVLAGLGLADLPPFATFLGKGWIEESSIAHGETWLVPVLIGCSAAVGGAVLRAAGGIFFGLGDPPAEDSALAQEANEETGETDRSRSRTPVTMLVPPALLVALAVAIAMIPPIGSVMEHAAAHFEDEATYQHAVLPDVRPVHVPAVPAPEPTGITASDVLTGLASTAAAMLVAAAGLYWRRLPLLRRGFALGASLIAPIERLQSGLVNDYVTWIVVGLGCLGSALALTIH